MSCLTSLLEQFSSQHVLVIGDAMLDVYLRGHAARLCQEAAVPVVDFDERTELPGGAANTALNLRALGAKVSLLSVVGRDRAGRQLCKTLTRQGVDTRNVLMHPQRKTLMKQRVIAGSQLVVRLDQGDSGPLLDCDQRALATRLAGIWSKYDAVVLSDYDYGVISPQIIEELSELSRRWSRTIIGDSKRLDRLRSVHFSAVKPNYSQAVELLKAPQLQGAPRVDQMSRLGGYIFELLDTDLVALTLDQDGALVFQSGRPPLRTFTEPNPQTHAAGAGDTYVAAMTLALACGGDAAAAAAVSAASAAIVVGKDGTSCCTAQELKNRLAGHDQQSQRLECLVPVLEEYRARGQRIVLTNGCFDILHRGHVTYLSQARTLGDVLVVGVNSDESIRRLKGPQRPINSLEDRMQVLAALNCVDHVVAFDEDTPHRLVKSIRPDVFVKGGDYTRDRLPEAALVEELGGRVEILPIVRERSTTKIINHIRAVDSAAAGLSALAASAAPIALPFSTRMS
jgi:D-beta-D-heptose 7-phosphate kinase / D-beta-D-heptose 1-phosphate adenosyltransferase